MAIAGISAASVHAMSSQPSSAHKQGARQSHSLTDIDAAGSSAASAPSVTGKIGSKVDRRV